MEVDEHLKEYQSCEELMKAISDELTYPGKVINEAKPIKLKKTALQIARLEPFLKGSAVAIIAILVLIYALSLLTLPRWHVPVDLLTVPCSRSNSFSA